MRTIDETCAEIKANGYANLTDEEVEAYMEWKTANALRDAEFQSKLKANQAAADAIIAAQQTIADNAVARYNEIMCNQPVPVKVEL